MGNLDLLEDACAALPHATRAMFGGHGLFAPNGGMFAGIVDDDRIILKLAQEEARAELVAEGGAPWTYQGKMTMKDWIVVPEAFYDEPRRLAEWARRAHRLAPPRKAKAAKRAKAPKSAKTAKRPGKKAAKKPAKKPTPARSTRGRTRRDTGA